MLESAWGGLVVFGLTGASPPVPEHPVSPVAVDLAYRAPAECPAPDVLLRQIGEGLGRTLVFDPSSDARVTVTVARADSGPYVLSLITEVSGQTESRMLEAAECAEVVDAGALVSALALEPFAKTQTSAPPVAQTADPPTPSISDAAPSAVREAPPDAGRFDGPRESEPSPHRASVPNSVWFFAEGVAAFVVTTTISGGVTGGLAWQRGRLRLRASARHYVARTTSEDPGVRLALTAGAVQGCFVPRWGRVSLATCGGVVGGAVSARAEGRDVAPAPRQVPWFALVAEVGPRIALTPWLAARISGALLAVPWRPAFHVRTPSENINVFKASAVAAQVSLGLEVRLFSG